MPAPKTEEDLYRQYLSLGLPTIEELRRRRAQRLQPATPAPEAVVQAAEPPTAVQPEPNVPVQPALPLTFERPGGMRATPPIVAGERARATETKGAEEALEQTPTYEQVPPGGVGATIPKPDVLPPQPGQKINVNPPTAGQIARSAALAFFKDATTVSADVLETISLMEDQINKDVGGRPVGAALFVGGKVSGKLGKIIRETADRMFPEDKILRQNFITQVAGGIGQSATFMAAGAAGGGGAVPVMTTGAFAGGSPAYRQAKESGATDDQAFASMLVGMGLGTTEAVPVAGWVSRLQKGVPGPLKKHVMELMAEGLEEGGQEFFQQFLQNAADKGIYDPKRNVWTGTVEGAEVGFTSGALISALVSAVTGVRARRGHPGVTPSPAGETPWGAGLEAKGLPGQEIEKKVASGAPLTPTEANLAKTALKEVQEVAAAPVPGVPPEVTQAPKPPPPTSPQKGVLTGVEPGYAMGQKVKAAPHLTGKGEQPATITKIDKEGRPVDAVLDDGAHLLKGGALTTVQERQAEKVKLEQKTAGKPSERRVPARAEARTIIDEIKRNIEESPNYVPPPDIMARPEIGAYFERVRQLRSQVGASAAATGEIEAQERELAAAEAKAKTEADAMVAQIQEKARQPKITPQLPPPEVTASVPSGIPKAGDRIRVSDGPDRGKVGVVKEVSSFRMQPIFGGAKSASKTTTLDVVFEDGETASIPSNLVEAIPHEDEQDKQIAEEVAGIPQETPPPQPLEQFRKKETDLIGKTQEAADKYLKVLGDELDKARAAGNQERVRKLEGELERAKQHIAENVKPALVQAPPRPALPETVAGIVSTWSKRDMGSYAQDYAEYAMGRTRGLHGAPPDPGAGGTLHGLTSTIRHEIDKAVFEATRAPEKQPPPKRDTAVDRELARSMASADTGGIPTLTVDEFIAKTAPDAKNEPEKFLIRMLLSEYAMPQKPKEVEAFGRRWLGRNYQSIDQVYDAIEATLNLRRREVTRHLQEKGSSLRDRIEAAATFEDRLGIRAKSLDVRTMQQFSTPFALAEGMAAAAAPRAGEMVMEPTAGTGSLLEPFIGRDDLSLWVNELDARRVAILKAVGYQAQEGSFFKPLPVSPQVVLVNPPWGAISKGYQKPPVFLDFDASDVSQHFIVHALRSMAKGGRLVTLVGENFWNPSSMGFRKWLAEHYQVRGAVDSPPGAYKRRGTEYGSTLVVIDNLPPEKGAQPNKVMLGMRKTPGTWEDYAAAIAEFADGGRLGRATDADLTRSQQGSTVTVGVTHGAATEGAERPGPAPEGVPGREPAAPAPGRPQPGRPRPGRGVGGIPGDTVRTGADVVPAPAPGQPQAPEPGAAPPLVQRVASEPHGEQGGAGVQDILARRQHDYDEARRSVRSAPYVVQGQWAGVAHPRLVVTNASLASVEVPALTHRPHPFVLEANRRGVLSDEAMDAIARATQNNLAGHGLIIGDATGFGKARENAGITLDWILSGHAKRVLVTSATRQNLEDLIETYKVVAGGEEKIPIKVVDLTETKVRGKAGPQALAEFHVTDKTVYLIDSNNFSAYLELIKKINPDGLMADEAHKFMNADAERGAAWLSLHKQMMASFEKPFFAYSTATVGTLVDDIGYVAGLRVWDIDRFEDTLKMWGGEVTLEEQKAVSRGATPEQYRKLQADASRGDEQAIRMLDLLSEEQASQREAKEQKRFGSRKSKEIWQTRFTPAASEQIMRELAEDGLYMSRDLWRSGVEMQAPEFRPPDEKLALFNRRINLMRDIEIAFHLYGKKNADPKRLKTIRGMLQFHYKRALFDLNLDNVLRLAKEEAKTGHQVVLSLINVAGTSDEEGEGNLAAAINAINTFLIEKEDGGGLSDPVEIPEALRVRANLMDRLAEEAPSLRDPLKEIEKALGKGNVGFITGMQTAQQKVTTNERFQSGQLQTVVISGAGKTGINLDHVTWADHFGSARGRRAMIIGDMQWSAADTMQELGRVDRASQLTPPKIIIPHLGLKAQRKFLATVAARLSHLGATSKGMEGSTGTEALDEFVMGGRIDNEAARMAYAALPLQQKELFTKGVFKNPNDKRIPAYNTKASLKDFLLDLQLMPVEQADSIMEEWFKQRSTLLEDPVNRTGAQIRASRGRGRSMEIVTLNNGLVLHHVKAESGAEYGILSGKMATTGKLAEIVQGGFTSTGETEKSARYVSMQDLDSGKWVSGVEIPYSRLPVLAKKYGAEVTRRAVTPDNIMQTLAMGLKVKIRGNGGATWELHRRRDGRTQIDGAKMKDEGSLRPAGLPPRAAYSPPGNYWWVPDETMPRFLQAFQIIQEEETAGPPEKKPPEGAPPVGPQPTSPPAAPAPVSAAKLDQGHLQINDLVSEKNYWIADWNRYAHEYLSWLEEPDRALPEPRNIGTTHRIGVKRAQIENMVDAIYTNLHGSEPPDIGVARRGQPVEDPIKEGRYEQVAEAERAKESEELEMSRQKAEQGAPADQAEPSFIGKADYLETPMGRVQFRFEVVPLEYLMTSHNPFTFSKSPGYPEGVQERPYHSDKSEQAKVVQQAASFMPGYVLSRTPSATDGAPILASRGPYVLGGNSRAMTMARAFQDDEAWQKYRIELSAEWERFGLTSEQFDKVFDQEETKFVLVRRLINSPGDRESMRVAARAFNLPLTQALNAEAEAVSRAKSLSQETLGFIGDALSQEEATTIAEVLRAKDVGREIVQRFIQDGIFSGRDVNRYTNKDGELNTEGRRVVELTLLASVVDDSDLLASAPPSLLSKVGKSVAALAELRSRPGWDQTSTMRKALLLAKQAQTAEMALKDYIAQGALFGMKEEVTEDVQAVAARLTSDKPLAFANRFRSMARESRSDIPGQGTLGLTTPPNPQDSFQKNIGGQDMEELLGRKPSGSEAGFINPALLGVRDSSTAQRIRDGIAQYVDAVSKQAADPKYGEGHLPPKEPITGLYGFWMRELTPSIGKERADKSFHLFRRHLFSLQLNLAYIDADTKKWFQGLGKEERAILFEAAKGIRRNLTTGEMEFGSLQPAGLLEISSVKDEAGETSVATNKDLGVSMDIDQAMQGGRLPNGYIIGELLPEYNAIQLWREITPEAGRRMYEEAVDRVPRGREILDDFTAVREEHRLDPLYGTRIPPRSREVLRVDYKIDAREPEKVAHVPSVIKKPKTFIGRIRRMLHNRHSWHRKLKTGVAAERGIELKDLAEATKDERRSIAVEQLRNLFVSNFLGLALERHNPKLPMPDGYVEFNRGALKDPDRFLGWISKNRDWLAEQDIDYHKVLEAGHYAAGKQYRVPVRILAQLEEMVGPEDVSADPATRALGKVADATIGGVLRTILATHLLRPSTANRNVVANEVIYGMMTLRDFCRGLLQLVPAARYEELPMAQFVADLTAYQSAWTKESRNALPAEALGRTFAMEMEARGLTDTLLGYFHAGDIWSARRVYEAVVRAQAHYAWRDAVLAKATTKTYKEFLTEYRKNLPPEVEMAAWHIRDIYGSGGGGDYWNISPSMRKLKKSHIGRGMIPYPTYFYKVFTGPMRTVGPMGLAAKGFSPGAMLFNALWGASVGASAGGPVGALAGAPIGTVLGGFFGGKNYADLFGPGREKNIRVNALANIMAASIMVALLWGAIPDAYDDYPKELDEKDIPPEFRTTGRLRLPDFASRALGAESDESYWVRVLDVPIVGDIIAAKAILRGRYGPDAYLHDRISQGPFAVMAALIWGYVDDFNKFKPPAAVAGEQVGTWGFYGPYRIYLRRLLDPYMRKTYRENDPFYLNFLRGYADTWPGFSRLLEGRHEREYPHLALKYPTKRPTIEIGLPSSGKPGGLGIKVPGLTGEDLKFWVLNIKPVKESRRRGAIAEAMEKKREREVNKLERPWAY